MKNMKRIGIANWGNYRQNKNSFTKEDILAIEQSIKNFNNGEKVSKEEIKAILK